MIGSMILICCKVTQCASVTILFRIKLMMQVIMMSEHEYYISILLTDRKHLMYMQFNNQFSYTCSQPYA